MSQTTKRALEASLKHLLLQKPLKKITINDIAEDCGISRMTVYYHVKDIYDLVEWACVEDAAQALLGGESLYIQASSNGGAVTLGRPSGPAAIRRGDGTIVAALNAEAPGTYVFAAFGGQEGKLLDAGVKTGSGPLGAGLEADVAEPAVRAFRLDDGLRPLGDAVDVPV